jgi:FkbM family methyltransferase
MTAPKRGTSVTVRGVTLPLGPHLSPAVVEVLHDWPDLYEKAEFEILRDHLRPGDRVLECGTGLGFLACHCARRVGSDRVWTYEANPDLEAPIREAFRLNGVSPALRMGVLVSGNSAAQVEFHLARDFWSGSSVPFAGSTKTIALPTISLPTELARLRPSFVIVDVEGAELELVAHCDFSGVEKVLIELHPSVIGINGVAVVESRLASLGFRTISEPTDPRCVFLER